MTNNKSHVVECHSAEDETYVREILRRLGFHAGAADETFYYGRYPTPHGINLNDSSGKPNNFSHCEISYYKSAHSHDCEIISIEQFKDLYLPEDLLPKEGEMFAVTVKTLEEAMSVVNRMEGHWLEDRSNYVINPSNFWKTNKEDTIILINDPRGFMYGSGSTNSSKFKKFYSYKQFCKYYEKYFQPKTTKIMTQKEIYQQLFKKWIELNDIKVGSKVKVLREFQTDYTGKVMTVANIDYDTPCILLDSGWSWRFECLEKVEEVTEIPVRIYSYSANCTHDAFDVIISKENTHIDGFGEYSLERLKQLVLTFKEAEELGVCLFVSNSKTLGQCDINTIERAIKKIEAV